MKVVIIGHSPGKVSPDKSITRLRVQKWLNRANVYEYDWFNLVNYHAPDLNLGDVTLQKKEVEDYDAVIALGNMAGTWLGRSDIPHLKVPHPSGLNRVWNDPDMEETVMQNIVKYLK